MTMVRINGESVTCPGIGDLHGIGDLQFAFVILQSKMDYYNFVEYYSQDCNITENVILQFCHRMWNITVCL
jgi:hypothetical protein